MPILSDNIILKLLEDVKDAKAKLSDISGQVDDLQDKTTGVNKTFSQLGKIAKVAISAVLIRKGAQALKRFGDQATRAFGAFEQSEQRSEERRVGKERRCRLWRDQWEEKS